MKLVMEECPTNMCHASTLLKLGKEQFLIAWFGGSKEGNGDTGIWITKGNESGFGKPEMIAQSDEAHWNPVLFRLNEQKIFLFYKVGNEIGKWRTMLRISDDNGTTFRQEQELVPGDCGGRGPVRNKPIRLKSGRILAPASTEQGTWEAFTDISDDGGKTFRKSQETAIYNLAYQSGERVGSKEKSTIPVSEQSFHGRGVIQPAVWESEEDKVHMLLRSSEGRIYRSDSEDGGETWSGAYPTGLPNNNSGIDLTKTSHGHVFLVYNPVDVNWGERTPISLAVSHDNGASFNRLMDLSSGEGEFSYPAMIADDEFLYITYTFKRQNIAFWKLSVHDHSLHPSDRPT